MACAFAQVEFPSATCAYLVASLQLWTFLLAVAFFASTAMLDSSDCSFSVQMLLVQTANAQNLVVRPLMASSAVDLVPFAVAVG